MEFARIFGSVTNEVDEEKVGRKRRPTSPLNPFYGFPVKFIADLCGVSEGTAEHYKAGRRNPPTPVLRLFRLYREEKVLGEDWDGYRIVGDKIFEPNGRAIRKVDIVLLGLLLQVLAEKDPDTYHALLEEAASMEA